MTAHLRKWLAYSVAASLLVMSSTALAQRKPECNRRFRVDANWCEARSAPTDDSVFLAKLVKNEIVSVCRREVDWTQIQLGSDIAWITTVSLETEPLAMLPEPASATPPAHDARSGAWCEVMVVEKPVQWIDSENPTSERMLPIGTLLARCGTDFFREGQHPIPGRLVRAGEGSLRTLNVRTPPSSPFGGGRTCREMAWTSRIVREGSPHDLNGELVDADVKYGEEVTVVRFQDGWLLAWVAGNLMWLQSYMVVPPHDLERDYERVRATTDCPSFYRTARISQRTELRGFDGTVLLLNVGVRLPVACSEVEQAAGLRSECPPTLHTRDGHDYYETEYLGHRGLLLVSSTAVVLDDTGYLPWQIRLPIVALEKTAPEAAAPTPTTRTPLDVTSPRLLATFNGGPLWLAPPVSQAFFGFSLGIIPANAAVYPQGAARFGMSGETTTIGVTIGVLWEPFGAALPSTLFALGANVAYDGIVDSGASHHLLTQAVELWVGWKSMYTMMGFRIDGGSYEMFGAGGADVGPLVRMELALGVWLSD